MDYQGTPLHQHPPLPLQDKSAASESINNCSVDQSELLEPSAVNGLQTNQNQAEQLPILESLAVSQSALNLSVEYSEASLTGALASTVNDLQTNSCEPEQLPILESPIASQSALNLSVESTQASLTGASASTSGSKDIELGATPNIQKQSSLELASEELSLISMTGADLAKRLGVATSTVSKMQSKPNFSDWSKQRDPSGIPWVKSLGTKLFYPQSQK